jgi:hypothetical protein
MISKDELLKGRDQQYPNDYTQEISDNLDQLLIPMNQVRTAWAKPMIVNSGWRPPEINASTPGAATHSKHMIGLAVDIADPDGSLWAWVLQNLSTMQQLNLFFEDKRWTPGWVHFQLGGPASGHRIFVPSAARPSAPDAWDGNYDHSYDQAA